MLNGFAGASCLRLDMLVSWLSVRFDGFTSAVQLDLYRPACHTTLSAKREDGLLNRSCAAA